MQNSPPSKAQQVLDAIEMWRGYGMSRFGLATYFSPNDITLDDYDLYRRAGVKAIFNFHAEKPEKNYHGVPLVNLGSGSNAYYDLDIMLIYEPIFDAVYQSIGTNFATNQLFRKKNIPVVPLVRSAIVSDDVALRTDLVRANSVIFQYLQRSGLKGSYVEFGTWFGRSFYTNMLIYQEQLKGQFWAFDSFGGLPKTRMEETLYTAEDWQEGRYFCNDASFRKNGVLSGVDESRVSIVSGFYSETLRGKTIADYGIKEKSISYAYIDCDLYDSTLDVLRFLYPALDDGAIMYFDDYYLARAGREAGEYHAIQVWLRENPGIDVIPFHREYWATQYVIFNRRWT